MKKFKKSYKIVSRNYLEDYFYYYYMFGNFCGDCWLCKRKEKKLLILNEVFLKGFFSFNSNEMTWILKDDL